MVEAAMEAAFAAIERVHRLMSIHLPDSDLSRLNRQGHKQSIKVDPWTYRVLAAAKRIGAASDGLFDCAVAPALARYGFLPRTAARKRASAATQREILLLKGCRVRFRQALSLDLGGIAKGFAIDRAVQALRAKGALSGTVNAGGDLRVFGPEPEPIHLRDPSRPSRIMRLGWLTEGAIATSGDYFERRRHARTYVSPIVDPQSGIPVTADRQSVSVIASDALTADALTKPVTLQGAAAADLLASFGARAVIVRAGKPLIEIGHAA
jgi:FAD:protein FMN transferase